MVHPLQKTFIETYEQNKFSWRAEIRWEDGELWATRYGVTELRALRKAERFLKYHRNIAGLTHRRPTQVYR